MSHSRSQSVADESDVDPDPMLEIEYTIPELPVLSDAMPNIFYDPVREKRRRMNIAGDQRIIRELDDIEVPLAGDTIGDLEHCRFVAPLTAQDAVAFIRDLRVVDAVFKRVMSDFHRDPETAFSKRALIALRVTRARIFQGFAVPNLILESRHKFTHQWMDMAKAIEPAAFLAILHTSQLLNKSPVVQQLLGTLGPSSEEFRELVAQRVFNPNVNKGPIMQYTLNELFTLVRFLERRWNYLEFVPDKFGFLLDVIIARLAELLTTAQPEAQYANLTSHRRLIANGLAVPTDICLQDFFWALIPMYRTLSLRTQFQAYIRPMPFVISDDWVAKVKLDAKQRCKEQKNVELQNKFYTKYSRTCLRPSEFKRYIRDHPGGDHLSSSILTEMRGQDAANKVQEDLAPLPWDLIDAAVLEPHEMDILYLMLYDTRFNNLGKGKFDWASTAVRYRGDMVDEENYVERLKDYEYPVIVQSFNTFGLFFEGEFYDHRDATRATIHWLLILLLRFKGVCMGSNFSSLHVLIPKELKDRLGIRYKS